MTTEYQWFNDSVLVCELPPLYRLHARYCRMMVNPRSGLVRGGSFLYRLMRQIQMRAHQTTAEIQVGPRAVCVDLLDERWFWVANEVRGNDADHHVLRAILRRGDTFVDVGANHGGFAIEASELVGPNGLVIAIEPQPRLADLLRRSLESNSFSPFEVHQCTCLDAPREIELYVPEQNSGSAGVFEQFSAKSAHRIIHVPGRTLDSILRDRSLPGKVFLKIDVEGSELQVLRGAAQSLTRLKPNLLLELNPTTAAAAGYKPAALLSYLAALGYTTASEVDKFPETVPLQRLPEYPQRNVLILSPA